MPKYIVRVWLDPDVELEVEAGSKEEAIRVALEEPELAPDSVRDFITRVEAEEVEEEEVVEDEE